MKDLPTPEDQIRKDLQDPSKVYTGKNILSDLPPYLKDPKNYMKIERALLECLSCRKAHSEPLEVANCKTCQTNLQKRRVMMGKFGFKSIEQFMAWRKTHATYKKLVPLDKYNKIVNR